MTKYTPEGEDAARPLPLPEKVGRVVQSLANSSLRKRNSEDDEPELSEEAVRSAIWAWRERAFYLPADLLCDPVWGMLLELLLGEVAKRRVTLSTLCNASAASTTTTLRWLRALENRDIIVRREDHLGSDLFALTPPLSAAMREYFRNVVQPR
jgi:hypothetical protein